MAYDTQLADRVRAYLSNIPHIDVQEKRMFGGLAFMVKDKMCINVSKNRLMCRFDPDKENEISQRPGYQPMNMKGKEMKGYCYVLPEGFESNDAFSYWVELCMEYNEKAKSSKK